MARDAISNRDWQTIVERLSARQCVPFLGAGVNAASAGYPGLPLGREVALRLAADLLTLSAEVGTFDELARVEVLNDALKEFPQLLRLELHDLARVAFYLERAVDSPHVLRLVRGMLADSACAPSELLTTLARLPVALIVTTNYDRLMEKALGGVAREYLTIVQPAGGFDPLDRAEIDAQVAQALADRTLILYKLHGSFHRDGDQARRERIILTEEDYIEFLTVVSNEQIGIPHPIRALMTTGTLLFLGYSLEDWDFRTLFKGTIERLERYDVFKSFAIQKDPPEFWAEFWEQKKVVIYDTDLTDFAGELRARYAAGTTPRAE